MYRTSNSQNPRSRRDVVTPGRRLEHAQHVSSLKIYFRSRLTAVASRILKSLIMDKSLGTLLHFRAFSNSHRSNPSPHPTNNVERVYAEFFFRVSTLYRVGGRRTAKKFRKRCTVLRGNREISEKYEYCSTVPRTFVQDCSNEIQAGAGREKQYGRITFRPKKKRIYCHSLKYYSPITMPL